MLFIQLVQPLPLAKCSSILLERLGSGSMLALEHGCHDNTLAFCDLQHRLIIGGVVAPADVDRGGS